MANNEQMMRELRETDPDELVELLQLSSEQLIKAFPAQVRESLNELRAAELELEEDEEEEPRQGSLRFFNDYDDEDEDDSP